MKHIITRQITPVYFIGNPEPVGMIPGRTTYPILYEISAITIDIIEGR